jgi:hypothetical protein
LVELALGQSWTICSLFITFLLWRLLWWIMEMGF